MNDDALFCPKCGTKVEEVVEANNNQVLEEESAPQPVEEKLVVKEETPKNTGKVKGARPSLHEQSVNRF